MNIGTETVGGLSQTYKYDDSKQLTQWKNGGNTVAYEYDSAGNISAAGSVNYSYNTGLNQLTSKSIGSGQATVFEYDPSGNLTKAISGADTTTYLWDGNNRLKEIGGADTTLTFAYDSENKRLTKTEGTSTTGFVYDGINLIAEKDSSGAITAKYYRNDAGQLVSMKKNGNNYYFHLNHRGDVVKITNSSETVVAEYSYDPWGNILETSGTFANEQPFRYASYYWDSEIGMYYLINRYYDPALRRFISKDPASEEVNIYSYSTNNPISMLDKDGRKTDPIENGGKWSGYFHDRQVFAKIVMSDAVGIQMHGLELTVLYKFTHGKISNIGFQSYSWWADKSNIDFFHDGDKIAGSPYDHRSYGHKVWGPGQTLQTEAVYYVGNPTPWTAPDLPDIYKHKKRIKIQLFGHKNPIISIWREGNYVWPSPHGATQWTVTKEFRFSKKRSNGTWDHVLDPLPKTMVS